MSELAATLLRFGYLLLLWILVLSAIGVLRSDIYGTRIRDRRKRAVAGTPAASARPAKSSKKNKKVQRDSQAPALLVVTDGPLTGATIALGSQPITIGRSPSCNLVLDDDYSSNEHARLYPAPDGWYLEDLNSTNGTRLGDERITAAVKVPRDALIHIGRSTMELRG